VDPSGNVSKAAPSFQYLVEKFTGAALEGSMTIEALSAKLVGKSHEATVGGRKYTTEKDGKKYNNTAGWLPFAGWSGETQIRYDGAWDEATPQGDSNVSDDSDGLPF